MRILRFEAGEPRIGVLKGETVVDVTEAGGRRNCVSDIIAAGPGRIAELRSFVDRQNTALKLAELKLLAPIERPGKYLAIGMNYGKHLEEADKLGVPRASHQVWFNKQTTCLSGPFDPIEAGVTEKLDYEVELGVGIGKRAKIVTEEDAL